MNPFSRFPLYSIAATVCAAVIATLLAVIWGDARVANVQREAVASQGFRLNQAALRAEEFLSVLKQLSRVQIKVIAPLRTRQDVAEGMQRLRAATDSGLIYGEAVAYAPYAFNHRSREFGVYVFASAKGSSLRIVGRGSERYEDTAWYQWGRAANGKLLFVPSYSKRGEVYIGAVQAFFRNKRFAGVVASDAEQSTLQRVLRKSLRAGDRMEILGATGQLLWSVNAVRVPEGSASMDSPLRLAPWTLRITSAMPEVDRAREETRTYSALAAVCIWIGALLICTSLLRARAFKLRALGLEEQSDELRAEILSRIAAEEQLRVVAYRDHLTGLPNRPHIVDQVNGMIDKIDAHPERQFALFFVDLDRFAVINDSLGHSLGDVVLTMVAQRLAERLPSGAGFGRIGGDEFIVCTWIGDGTPSVSALANSLLNELRRSIVVADREIALTGSIGVVVSAERYTSADAMIRDADIAMYAAKQAGRSRFALFDQGMHDRAMKRMSLESQIRGAIKRNEFVPHYQPIIELATGNIRSVEALARWTAPDFGSSDTGEVILVAEQSGLISAVDRSILEQVCRDAAAIEELLPDMRFSVNVSATYLQQEDFIPKLSAILDRTSTSPSRLRFEITETAIMNQPDEALRTLERIRALGSQVVIDDFGMGHSSLSYAQRLPIAGLKIDRSFISPIAKSAQSAAIVRAIVAMAQSLGLHTTAEGIETKAQLDVLVEIGVDYGQGWYFSKALPFDDFVAYAGAERNTRFPGVSR